MFSLKEHPILEKLVGIVLIFTVVIPVIPIGGWWIITNIKNGIKEKNDLAYYESQRTPRYNLDGLATVDFMCKPDRLDDSELGMSEITVSHSCLDAANQDDGGWGGTYYTVYYTVYENDKELMDSYIKSCSGLKMEKEYGLTLLGGRKVLKGTCSDNTEDEDGKYETYMTNIIDRAYLTRFLLRSSKQQRLSAADDSAFSEHEAFVKSFQLEN